MSPNQEPNPAEHHRLLTREGAMGYAGYSGTRDSRTRHTEPAWYVTSLC
jgi:hypothetical protein